MLTCFFLFLLLCFSMYLFTYHLLGMLLNLPPTLFIFVRSPIPSQKSDLQKLHRTLLRPWPHLFQRFSSGHVLLAILGLQPTTISYKTTSYSPTDRPSLQESTSIIIIHICFCVEAPILLLPPGPGQHPFPRGRMPNTFLLTFNGPGQTVNWRQVLFNLTFNITMMMIGGKRYYGRWSWQRQGGSGKWGRRRGW